MEQSERFFADLKADCQALPDGHRQAALAHVDAAEQQVAAVRGWFRSADEARIREAEEQQRAAEERKRLAALGVEVDG